MGTETDSQLLRRAMRTLRFTQTDIANVLGITQGAISHILRKNTKLNRLARLELKKRTKLRELANLVAEGKAMTLRPCRGHTLTDFETFANHLMECPMCIARSYRAITRQK